MLASVSLRLSSEGGVAVSSVLGTTHFVRVPRRTQAKKKRRLNAAAFPLTSDTARGIKLINRIEIVVVVFGHKHEVRQGVARKGAPKRDRQKIGGGNATIRWNCC